MRVPSTHPGEYYVFVILVRGHEGALSLTLTCSCRHTHLRRCLRGSALGLGTDFPLLCDVDDAGFEDIFPYFSISCEMVGYRVSQVAWVSRSLPILFGLEICFGPSVDTCHRYHPSLALGDQMWDCVNLLMSCRLQSTGARLKKNLGTQGRSFIEPSGLVASVEDDKRRSEQPCRASSLHCTFAWRTP